VSACPILVCTNGDHLYETCPAVRRNCDRPIPCVAAGCDPLAPTVCGWCRRVWRARQVKP